MGDINLSHLLYTKTPASWHPYILLARLDRPAGTWLLLLPCWWALTLAAPGIFNINWMLVVLFAVGALLMRSAGCVINDLWDQKIDAEVERTRARPLASGALTRRQAFAFLAVLLTMSGAILLTMGWLAILLGILSLALVVAYPYMKRVTWWPQLFLGFTFNWGALLGWAAAAGHVPPAAFLLYAGGIFWTLAYDTIYAHQDIEDDRRIGVKSTARLFGDKSKTYVKFFLAAAIAFFVAAKYLAAISPMTFLFLLPVIVHAVWQMRVWNPADPHSSLRVFRANVHFSWLVLLLFSL